MILYVAVDEAVSQEIILGVEEFGNEVSVPLFGGDVRLKGFKG